MHSEADRLEHHLSEELEATIDRALGFPRTDPHGDPIPTADLVMAPPDHRERLGDLEPGHAAVVRHVPDGDPQLLRYLGLLPDARVELEDKAPLGGPVTISVAGERQALGVELAARIRVDVEA